MNAATSGQMLLAFWRQRDRESPWGRRLLIALTLLGLGASLYAAPGLWAAVLAGSATLALGGLWTAVAGSLLTQNHPHAARVVPGHLRQLRQAALSAWAVLSLACAPLAWAADDPALLCLAFGALPLSAAWLLRAPAAMRAPSSWTAVLPVLAFLLLAWGLYAAKRQLGLPLAALAGLSVGASLALGAWRWRRVCRAPRPLPAGRLG